MKHLGTLFFFVAAAAGYALSSLPGAVLLLFVGLVLESSGGYRIVRSGKRARAAAR